MTSDCNTILSMMPSFSKQTLSDEQLEVVAVHINHCAGCLDQFEKTSCENTPFHFDDASFEAPHSLKANILNTLEEKRPRKSVFRLPRLLPLFSSSFAVASLCLFAFNNVGAPKQQKSTPDIASTAKHQQPIIKVNQANHTLNNPALVKAPSVVARSPRSVSTGAPHSSPQRGNFFQIPRFNAPSAQFVGWEETRNTAAPFLHYHFKNQHENISKIRVQPIASSKVDFSLFVQTKHKGKAMWFRKMDSGHLIYIQNKAKSGLLIAADLPKTQLFNFAATLDTSH